MTLAVPVARPARPPVPADWKAWVLIGVGLAAMYLPTFVDLFRTVWATEAQGHGPIVLAVSAWLLWRAWPQLADIDAARPWPIAGSALAAAAVMFYVLGRSQDFPFFEVGSLVFLLGGLLLLIRGPAQLKAVSFALFFMLFMVPLPGIVVDTLTQPMKMAVSWAAEQVLNAFDYPISRSGVILQIGPYQLLVADACAGLHTLFTLEALGLLYLNVVRHSSMVRNVGLAVLIVPISFTANVIRVMVLTLVTYHLGDEAGQGFLHGFAGMVLFATALGLIIATDTALRWGGPRAKLGSRGAVA